MTTIRVDRSVPSAKLSRAHAHCPPGLSDAFDDGSDDGRIVHGPTFGKKTPGETEHLYIESVVKLWSVDSGLCVAPTVRRARAWLVHELLHEVSSRWATLVSALSLRGEAGRMFRLSTCSLCPACQPGRCDGETGQQPLCMEYTAYQAKTSLLAAAMPPRPDRAGLGSTRRDVSIDAESHTRGWDGSPAAQCEFARTRHKADGGACFVEGER